MNREKVRKELLNYKSIGQFFDPQKDSYFFTTNEIYPVMLEVTDKFIFKMHYKEIKDIKINPPKNVKDLEMIILNTIFNPIIEPVKID